MPGNISGHKLLIISDTAVYKSGNKVLVYEPVLREVEHLSELFDEIIWLGCRAPNSTTVLKEVTNSKIRVITMPSVRHRKLNAFFVLLAYPAFIYHILKHLPTVKYVHTRAPSHPAWLGILFSRFDNSRIYWHKYAGNWIAPKLPYTYSKQRGFLKRINRKNIKVTVNGQWDEGCNNIYSFENPSMTEVERIEAKKIADNKNFSGSLKLLFVGELNEKKGILQLLDALKSYAIPENFTDIYVAGNGPLADVVKNKVNDIGNLSVHLLGTLNREQLNRYYGECHFLMLPSFSEGFPKVIAEAAAFGCIPIVTNLSSIDQYIIHNQNGFLLQDNGPQSIVNALQELPNRDLKQISENVTSICERFTYEHYLQRIRTEIFNG